MNLKNPNSKENQQYDWDSILDKEIEKIDLASKFSRIILCIKSTLALALTKPNFPKDIKSDFLFFISLNRSDHLNIFYNIFNQCEHKKISHLIKFPLSLNLINTFSYIYNLRKLFSFHRKSVHSYYAYTCYIRYKSIPKYLDKYEIKYLLTYADFLPLDNLLTQYFKMKNIKTITLQEGGFLDNSSCYPGLLSDYFLCWGNNVKDNTLNNPNTKTDVRVLGLPLQFNQIDDQPYNNIYVPLSGDVFIDINKKILSIALSLNKTIKGNIFVQFHPKSNLSLYPNLDLYTLVSSPPNRAQLTIGYYSTICISLLLSNYHLYFYKNDTTESIWENGYLFTSSDDLLNRIKKNYQRPPSLHYFISSIGNDAATNYHEFFSELTV